MGSSDCFAPVGGRLGLLLRPWVLRSLVPPPYDAPACRLLAAALQQGNAFEETRCSARKFPIVRTAVGMKTKDCFSTSKSYRRTKPWQRGEKKEKKACLLTFFIAAFSKNVCVEKRESRRVCDASQGGNEKTRERRSARGERVHKSLLSGPTMRAFHVWNLDIINNESSRTAAAAALLAGS